MLPPGPDDPPLTQTLRWAFQPLPFLEECREKYGDAFSVEFMGFESPVVMVSDPKGVKALYSARDNGLTPAHNFSLEPMLGPRSVMLLEGSDHLSRRKLMLPAFHGERMRSYESVVDRIVAAEIDSWPIGEEFPIHPPMQAVTLEVILQVIFGVNEDARLARLRRRLGDLLVETERVVPKMRLISTATRQAVDEQLFEEIAARRLDPDLESRGDILSALMLARFENGEAMSDVELRDQLMTLLLAGHETTATALAWAFDLLLRNPAALESLRASLREGEQAYLQATISEALRLRPVLPITGRRIAEDLVGDGYTLPAGTDVASAIWLIHTRPEAYPDPLAFRPERFLGDGPETYGWIPFGGGIRRCLGASFSEFEMRAVLRQVLTRCDLHKADPRPEQVARRQITLSPRAGTPVVVTRRRPASGIDSAAA